MASFLSRTTTSTFTRSALTANEVVGMECSSAAGFASAAPEKKRTKESSSAARLMTGLQAASMPSLSYACAHLRGRPRRHATPRGSRKVLSFVSREAVAEEPGPVRLVNVPGRALDAAHPEGLGPGDGRRTVDGPGGRHPDHRPDHGAGAPRAAPAVRSFPRPRGDSRGGPAEAAAPAADRDHPRGVSVAAACPGRSRTA